MPKDISHELLLMINRTRHLVHKARMELWDQDFE